MNSLICLVLATGCLAAPLQQEEDEQAELKTLLKRAVRQDLQRQLTGHIGIEIEDMTHVLKLAPAKIKRLRLAAKGVAGKFIDRYEAQVIGFIRQHVNETDASVNGIHIESLRDASEKIAAVPATRRARNRVALVIREDRIRPEVSSDRSTYGTSVRGGLREFRRQGLWTKVVSTVLSAQERETYQQAVTERRRRRYVQLVNLRWYRIQGQVSLLFWAVIEPVRIEPASCIGEPSVFGRTCSNGRTQSSLGLLPVYLSIRSAAVRS